MAKEFKMSQARYDELKQELDYSKTTRADEVAELIKEARGFGDLSENSEYDEAKNEQGKLYSRIAELEASSCRCTASWAPRRRTSCPAPSARTPPSVRP